MIAIIILRGMKYLAINLARNFIINPFS